MITFARREHCSSLRLGEYKYREFWLYELVQLDDSIEVTLSRHTDGKNHRLGRWAQISPASDETTARALILESEATRVRS